MLPTNFNISNFFENYMFLLESIKNDLSKSPSYILYVETPASYLSVLSNPLEASEIDITDKDFAHFKFSVDAEQWIESCKKYGVKIITPVSRIKILTGNNPIYIHNYSDKEKYLKVSLDGKTEIVLNVPYIKIIRQLYEFSKS